MKHIRTYLAALILLVIPVSSTFVMAEADIAGEWAVTLYDQNQTLLSDERWTLITGPFPIDTGVAYIGSGSNGSITWTTTAVVENFELSQVNTYNAMTNFVVVYQGTVNQSSTEIAGTWIDSTAAQGTFTAQRAIPTDFGPKTPLTEAPHITIAGDDITVTMEKFTKALPKGANNGKASIRGALPHASAAKSPKITISYEVTIKGTTRQQTRKTIISKRNQVTVRNLKPGNYTSSYKVKAIQNGAAIYSSKSSPKATFTVR